VRRAAALLLAAAATACVPDEGPMMEPGRDCLSCHDGSGEERAWSFAGTVFARGDAAEDEGIQGVTVIVEDARGKRVSVTSNDAGNFYSAERLVPPFRAKVRRGATVVEMEGTFEYGSCNACHTWPARPAFPDLHRLVAP